MSSAPLQPERLIWNLHSVLLANDSGNARQEQRRIVACPLLNLLSNPGSKCMLQYCSKLAYSCTSGSELSLFAHSQLNWMPHCKQEAVGMCISYPKLNALLWQAFSTLNCQYSSNWSRGRLKPIVSTWQSSRKVQCQGTKRSVSNNMLHTWPLYFLERVKEWLPLRSGIYIYMVSLTTGHAHRHFN